MPIYEYQCQACGHTLESLQKMSDAPLTDCPSCQEAKLEKLVSATSFQLKGTGWYVTDFRNKNQSTNPESSSTGKADSASTNSTPTSSTDN